MNDSTRIFENPYQAGYDAGLNGVNTENTNFRWFSTEESMLKWSAGNKAGLRKKEEIKQNLKLNNHE